MSWLGIDVGAKRSGVAISRSGQLSEPLALVHGNLQEQVDTICEMIGAEQVKTVVVGLPRGQNKHHPAQVFLLKLKTVLADRMPFVSVATVDETLSTKEAERLAKEAGTRTDTDLLAACLILEQYLQELRSQNDE